MTPKTSTLADAIVADPKDRFWTPLDPWLRNRRWRFIALVIAVCLLHAGLLAFLLTRDRSLPPETQKEIPVEVVVVPPPPPPPPAPPEKKKQQPKPKPPPQEKQKQHFEKPATDAPRAQNNEKIEREDTDKETQAPTRDKPVPNAQMKPTPTKMTPAQNAAPAPAERTAAPEVPDDKPDAEALSKAAPIKDPKETQKEKPAKEKAALPSREKASLAQEFAALSQSPRFTIAARAKPTPVSGGHCDSAAYLCTLYALIMRQQHYPADARARGMRGTVVIGFWLDERGTLTHQALYRTSGYPELDRAAGEAIRRAAPFPPPPPDQPHGFVAQMAFPPK